MVVGELEYQIKEQKKEIKQLNKENEFLINQNKDLKLLTNRLTNGLQEIIKNEIDINELRTIYNKIEYIINNSKQTDITNHLKDIQQETNNNYLFLLAMYLFDNETHKLLKELQQTKPEPIPQTEQKIKEHVSQLILRKYQRTLTTHNTTLKRFLNEKNTNNIIKRALKNYDTDLNPKDIKNYLLEKLPN